jgi:hypothetical protein
MVNREEMDSALENPKWPATFQLLHYDSTFKIDIFLSEDLEYDKLVAERARSAEIASRVKAWYVSAEDIVLMKLRWYDLGNRISDRQWNDLLQVIEVQGEAFDRDYLIKWAEYFEVRGLAEEALREARP